MIEQVDIWLGQSINNFNFFVGVQTLLGIASVAVLFFYTRKIGKADERTIHIQYKIISTMFYTLAVMNILFFTQVSANMHYFRQYVSLGMILSVTSGAIASAYYARKELK